MKSSVRLVSLAAVLCVLTGVVQAADGILLVQKTTIAGGESRTNQIQIEKARMRAESTGLGGEKQVVVFDGTKQVMTQINDQKKTYTEITKADLEAISGQMAGMMAQMEQQLKSLPPEQRAKLEEMMKGRGMGGAAAPERAQYKKVGTATVGKWACDQYEGYAGGQKTSEVCTVDPKTLGFSSADFEVARQLAAFFEKLLPPGAAQAFTLGIAGDQGLSGIPVRSVVTAGGRQTTTEVTEVGRQTFADAIFQVPAGYQKQNFMGGMGGRGRQ